MQNRYGLGKTVSLGHAAAIARVTEELQKEGFGVLTTIDMAGTLKKKIDKDILPYVILGACNPSLAARAVEVEPSIGLLLPCNIVVRQDAARAVHVDVIDPVAMFKLVDQPGVETIASEVRQRLDRVLAAL